jgi:hypothetical protein
MLIAYLLGSLSGDAEPRRLIEGAVGRNPQRLVNDPPKNTCKLRAPVAFLGWAVKTLINHAFDRAVAKRDVGMEGTLETDRDIPVWQPGRDESQAKRRGEFATGSRDSGRSAKAQRSSGLT